MDEGIRVRFAPSPTGKFHIGNARTALFNYLLAKKSGGKFVLRIEDTDRKRSTEEYEQDILESLGWLSLSWDEGPIVGGEHGPYRQSERMDKYKEYIDLLLQNGQAYYCYCTPEELAKEREEQEKKHQAPRYSGRCRNLTPEQVEQFKKEGRKPTVRFIAGEEIITFTDMVKGPMEFNMKDFGDFVIVGSDGQPLFLLTNAIDDSLMKITHALRGEDHLSNTPKQIAILKALSMMPPEYGHLPLILNPDRTKLSKRKNPTSVTDDFKLKGFLPQALANFMALLGWSPGDDREIFSLDELTMEFSVERVSKSSAIFDMTKLEYLNGYYIRHLSVGELASACLPFLEKESPEAGKMARKNPEYFLQIIAILQERMKRLDEIGELSKFFFTEEVEYDAELLIPKKSSKETVLKALKVALSELKNVEPFCRDNLEKTLRGVATDLGIGAGEVLWPVRAAITGEKASPGVFEVLEVLGKERSLKRISTAIEKLER